MSIDEFKREASKDPDNIIEENEEAIFAYKKGKNFGGWQKTAKFVKKTGNSYFSDYFWCEEEENGKFKEYCNINGIKTLVI